MLLSTLFVIVVIVVVENWLVVVFIVVVCSVLFIVVVNFVIDGEDFTVVGKPAAPIRPARIRVLIPARSNFLRIRVLVLKSLK